MNEKYVTLRLFLFLAKALACAILLLVTHAFKYPTLIPFHFDAIKIFYELIFLKTRRLLKVVLKNSSLSNLVWHHF